MRRSTLLHFPVWDAVLHLRRRSHCPPMIPASIVTPSMIHTRTGLLSRHAQHLRLLGQHFSRGFLGDPRRCTPCARVSQCQHRLTTLHDPAFKLLLKVPARTCFHGFQELLSRSADCPLSHALSPHHAWWPSSIIPCATTLSPGMVGKPNPRRKLLCLCRVMDSGIASPFPSRGLSLSIFFPLCYTPRPLA